jgi:hypothetical protein
MTTFGNDGEEQPQVVGEFVAAAPERRRILQVVARIPDEYLTLLGWLVDTAAFAADRDRLTDQFGTPGTVGVRTVPMVRWMQLLSALVEATPPSWRADALHSDLWLALQATVREVYPLPAPDAAEPGVPTTTVLRSPVA